MSRGGTRPLPRLALRALWCAAWLGVAGAAPASEGALSTSLCEVLKELAPDVRSSSPEGAQAQLVMALAQAYQSDATQLRQVKREIDDFTSANCAAAREAILAALKTPSLGEALR